MAAAEVTAANTRSRCDGLETAEWDEMGCHNINPLWQVLTQDGGRDDNLGTEMWGRYCTLKRSRQGIAQAWASRKLCRRSSPASI